MRKLIIGAALASMIATPALARETRVDGYYRKDGTYVQPHVRTTPNSTKMDNYSTQGNWNPNTGQMGTVDPYKPTQSNPTGSPYNKDRRSSF